MAFMTVDAVTRMRKLLKVGPVILRATLTKALRYGLDVTPDNKAHDPVTGEDLVAG